MLKNIRGHSRGSIPPLHMPSLLLHHLCHEWNVSCRLPAVSWHRVLIQSGPGNRGRSACGTTHVASLEFPRETRLILRRAGKAGNPFQTTQGNLLSCRDQEGRRGSEEAVPGPSVFTSREPGVPGNLWGSHEGCQVPFRTSGRNLGLPLRRRSGQGPHPTKTLEPRGFSRVAAGSWSYDGDFRLPLVSALGEARSSIRVARESWGLRSSHCRAKETSSRRVSET